MPNGTDNLIVIKRLPEIEQHLISIKATISERLDVVDTLDVTEETVKEAKRLRVQFNKEIAALEARRKEVKNSIMQPYNDFEQIYKACVSEQYDNAIKKITDKINSVENALKAKKANEIEEYFREYAENLDVGFLNFEDAEVNVTLSASLKKLKEDAKAYVDKVAEELKVLKMLDEADEVLYEYMKCRNLSEAVTNVKERHKALKETPVEGNTEEISKAQEETNDEPLSAPVEEKVIAVQFTVYGTKEQLLEVKNYIKERGLRYE